MNLWQRIKNVWKLSEFEPGQPTDEYKTPGTVISMIVKKPSQKAVFIPHVKIDPVKEITQEHA